MSEVSHQKVWSQRAKPLLSCWVGHVIECRTFTMAGEMGEKIIIRRDFSVRDNVQELLYYTQSTKRYFWRRVSLHVFCDAPFCVFWGVLLLAGISISNKIESRADSTNLLHYEIYSPFLPPPS